MTCRCDGRGIVPGLIHAVPCPCDQDCQPNLAAPTPDRPEWLKGLWVNVYSGTWVKTGWGTEPRSAADCDEAAGRDRVGRVHLWDGEFVPCNGSKVL